MVQILNILKWMLKIGPIVFELVKLTVKIVQEYRKLKKSPAQTIRDYRREQQKKKSVASDQT